MPDKEKLSYDERVQVLQQATKITTETFTPESELVGLFDRMFDKMAAKMIQYR